MLVVHTHALRINAALSVGAGNLGRCREIFHAINHWQQCGTSLEKWQALIENPVAQGREDVWLPMEHAPGF